MDRRWLIPVVLAGSLLAWYLVEAVPKLGQAELPDQAGQSEEAPEPETMRVVRDIPYVERPGVDPVFTSLDLYAPLFEGPHPVVMLIHGGGWRWGDKSRGGLIEGKPAWLTSRGYLLISLNYRVAPSAQHPASVQDIAAAIKWVRDHAWAYGGDPERLILLGHATGAQLAALVALDGRYLAEVGAPTDAVAGLILLDGRAYDIPRHLQDASPRQREWYESFFSADPEVQKDASPITYVATAAVLPPTLIVYRADRPWSADQGKLLSQAMIDAGGKVEVLPVENKSGLSLRRDLGAVDDEVTRAVEQFLEAATDPARFTSQPQPQTPSQPQPQRGWRGLITAVCGASGTAGASGPWAASSAACRRPPWPPSPRCPSPPAPSSATAPPSRSSSCSSG